MSATPLTRQMTRPTRLAARLVAVVVAGALLLTAAPASADDRPDLSRLRLTFGPSLAYGWDHHGSHAVVPGVDLSFAGWLLWGTVGFRSLLQEVHRAYIPYVEVGAWFFVNAGVGYDCFLTPGIGVDHGFHLFVGFPFPAGGDPLEGVGFYVQPYVRLGFIWGDRDSLVVPEVGFLFKFSAALLEL